MKILLVNSTAYPTIGGVENSLRFMGRELLRAGHEVKIFCFQSPADQPLRTEHEGIEIIRCPYSPSRWPHKRMRYQVELVRSEIQPILREYQPDAVWSRSACMGLGVALSGFQGLLLQIFCTTASMDSRGLYLQNSSIALRRNLMMLGLYLLHYPVACRIERELLVQCQPIVFSENMRTQLEGRNGQRPSSVKVIPPGVDTGVFSVENAMGFFRRIEETYGFAPDAPYVLYVGRLSTAKNIPLLIEAIAKLEQSVKLVLVGSGPEEHRLRDYARKKGMANRVIFAGSQSDWLSGFYALAKVCVLPTTIESFGQVYLESLACGTPVVGFAGDGRKILTATQEVVRDGETGAVVNRVNAESLAEKIDSILSLDDDGYAAMSQRAREDVVARFSWRRFVEEALSLSVQSSAADRGKET